MATVFPLHVPASAAGGFVGRSGSHFTLNGQTWYVAGTNNHYLGWGSQAEVDNVLNDAKAMHFNVVRTILHSVRGSLDGSVPTKWNWASTGDTSNMGMHGVYILYWNPATSSMAYNDSTTDGLGRWDYVIWKAGQLGLKLDISLLDFWQWAGGVQQINANFKGGNYDMSSAGDRYTFFFQDSRTKQFYKDWVNHVVNRVNSLTGVAYKNDPTIFAWDLMNEPEISGTTLGQGWISEMASYVKSVAPNHLLATGSEGFADAHVGTSVSLDITSQPNIDFATWHTYPDYHGISTSQVNTLIDQNCATAVSGGKPVLMQEFGYSFSHSDQSSVYQSWVDELYNKDCAGWTFWRLTGKEDSGSYPPDNGEGFDIHNDGSASATVFINAAIRSLSRNSSQPTNTPGGPTATRTNTPAPTKTNTPTPTTVPGTVTVDDSVMGSGQNQFNYAGGGWSHCTNCNEASPAIYYNASQSWDDTTNDSVTIAFTGTQIKYYAVTAPHHGIAAVSIDGGSETNVDLYSATKTGNVLVWTSPTLSAGSHTLKIRVTGTHNASSTDNVVTLDRVDILGGSSPTFQPPTNTPRPSTPTNTPGGPTATRTNTPAPTKTNTPGSGGTNIAPSGNGYTWFNISSTYSGNQRTEPGVNDGNLSQDFALTGSGDDNTGAQEAAGVVWSVAQTIRSVKYYNGSCDQYQNGPFTGSVQIQFTTDGSHWTTDSSWTVSPAYAYDSCGSSPTADGQVFTFSGTAKTGVIGVRVLGVVHTTNNSLSWHAIAKEVQVFN